MVDSILVGESRRITLEMHGLHTVWKSEAPARAEAHTVAPLFSGGVHYGFFGTILRLVRGPARPFRPASPDRSGAHRPVLAAIVDCSVPLVVRNGGGMMDRLDLRPGDRLGGAGTLRAMVSGTHRNEAPVEATVVSWVDSGASPGDALPEVYRLLEIEVHRQ
jgi:hypothetical protein